MSVENTQIQNEPMLNDDGSRDRPRLPKWLFWDVRHESMNWKKASRYVVERILERGNNEDLQETIRFYGRRKVMRVLRKEPIYLMDHSIERACAYFNLKPEELRCYTRKRLRQGHWV